MPATVTQISNALWADTYRPICGSCGGDGWEHCPTCGGCGEDSEWARCRTCQGSGNADTPCPSCHGSPTDDTTGATK